MLRLVSKLLASGSDANDFALPLRALARVAQEQEPRVRGGAAGGGGGLGYARICGRGRASADQRCGAKALRDGAGNGPMRVLSFSSPSGRRDHLTFYIG